VSIPDHLGLEERVGLELEPLGLEALWMEKFVDWLLRHQERGRAPGVAWMDLSGGGKAARLPFLASACVLRSPGRTRT
jgi:hypothetical protein